ncbi:toxin-activating lysine-acyltransferase [Ramlibacter sp. MAHUQ-53]|uniref:toxin-activating lysine-acyltransferase n=1 Tax=unclassified Ramlibacter TaxID=2617605 RepID=UPI003640A615
MTASPTFPPAPADGEPLDALAALARTQAAKVMKKVPLLGTVSWLMLAAPTTRHALLSDLEWRVMPPLMLNQAKVYLRDETPVAFVSWARLSPEVARRFRCLPHRLTPADWRSGEEVWVVDLLAPFGGAREVMKDLRENVLPGQVVRQLALAGEPEAEVYTWPAG